MSLGARIAIDDARKTAHPARPIGTELLRFDSISKSYDGKTYAVEDLNLTVQEGEFLTFLGPSGSGKTTTLMMLAGFEAPDQGEILFNGKRLDVVPPHHRNFGMVFQDYALFPHMTVAGNLAYPLRIRSMPKDAAREKVETILKLLQLRDFRDRYPRQLSGGQQQRVALGRALVFNPRLVLMDEPLGALDRQLREQMQIEIKHLHRALGTTIISVTHDQGEALTMSDRVAVFSHGRIQQVGAPEELYERPANAFVASFLGESNFIPGIVERANGGTCAIRSAEGVVLSGFTSDPVRTAAPVLASIRPERIRLTDVADSAMNQISGEVLELLYFGDSVKIRLRTGGSDKFFVKLPVGELPAGLKEGARLTAAWQPAHTLIFKEGEQ